MIDLRRMGGNMVRRLLAGGRDRVVFELLSAMPYEFGGDVEKAAGKK
jgi:6-phosphogluconate dehydrogenase (decarboxylating)